MSFIVSYFRTIIILIIFITFISILLPSKKYKSFLDFTLGLILISVILSPITKLMKIDKTFNYKDLPFSSEYNDTSVYDMDKNYTKVLYEDEVAKQMQNSIKTNLLIDSDVSVVFGDDLASIENVSIKIKSGSIYIEPINILENAEVVENKDIKDIKNLIFKEYNLSEDNINVI